jgi:hypothetical protein
MESSRVFERKQDLLSIIQKNRQLQLDEAKKGQHFKNENAK